MAISTKTNWQDGETVYASDLNRIENNSKELSTNVDAKAARGEAQTITGQWSFQHKDGTKFRRSISSIWYECRVMPLEVIINGENSAGMVFNRNGTDLARFVFNQNGAMLVNLSTSDKYTIIHTGNLDLVTSVSAATVEE